MSHTAARKEDHRPTLVPDSFDKWFDREIEEINADLARLQASMATPAPQSVKPRPRRKRAKPHVSKPTDVIPSVGTSMATPAATAPAAVPSPVVTAAPAAPSAQPLPTGTNLADPNNFGLMPPTADLERGTANDDEYRQHLSRHIVFATKVLHPSRVSASVWREWRAFEKTAQQRLRALADVFLHSSS